MNTCNKHHPQYAQLSSLPTEQYQNGEIKCAGCAYEIGFDAGSKGQAKTLLDFNTLPNVAKVIHEYINPQAAFAYGCLLGLTNAKNES